MEISLNSQQTPSMPRRQNFRMKKPLPKSRKKLDLKPIYIEVIKLLIHKNPEQISFSLVARKTNVPRTTLYYYFGSNVEDLILEAVKYSMKEFMQLWEDQSHRTTQNHKSWQELQERKFFDAIQLVSESPWFLKLYFRYCGHFSYVGDEIRRVEKVYLAATDKDWHRFHKSKLKPQFQYLLSQLKIGVLWGLLGQDNQWKGQERLLASYCSRLFARIEDF